jgi:hypothetical protein
MDQCQVSLRLFSPMLYRVEELGIYPGPRRASFWASSLSVLCLSP